MSTNRITQSDLDSSLRMILAIYHKKQANRKSHKPQLGKWFLHYADSRLGRRVAIAECLESGGVNVLTSFMSWKEFTNFAYSLGSLGRHVKP